MSSFATLGSPWALHSPAKNFEYFIETCWATANTATVTQRCKTDEINWNSYIIIWAHVLAYIEKVIWKKRYNNCSKKKLTTSTSVDINSKNFKFDKNKIYYMAAKKQMRSWFARSYDVQFPNRRRKQTRSSVPCKVEHPLSVATAS